MGAAIGAGAANVGAYLMGRVLYEEWAAYWPEHADEPFGDVLNSTKKYVVSNTLTSAEWQNSEILSGDVASKVAGLKTEDGGDFVMSGSATTVRWLLRRGLLDELRLFVHPIVVGAASAVPSSSRATTASTTLPVSTSGSRSWFSSAPKSATSSRIPRRLCRRGVRPARPGGCGGAKPRRSADRSSPDRAPRVHAYAPSRSMRRGSSASPPVGRDLRCSGA